MKFPTAYYLILLYSTVLFKPLIPVIGDAYAHIFAKAIHEATVHASFGSNHLQKALAATGEETTSSKNQKAGDDAAAQYPVHIAAGLLCMHHVYAKHITRSYLLYRPFRLLPVFISIISPPPKFS